MTTDKSLISLFNDINDYLLSKEKPSFYLCALIGKPEFEKEPFLVFKRLQKTEQSPIYHPEGNVWKHTMLVVDEAAKTKNKSSDQKAFMWAALLHDIGKPATTKNRKGKITSYDHDKVGAELAQKFLTEFTDNNDFISRTVSLVRLHMQPLYVLKNLPFQDIDAIISSGMLNDIALFGYCDRAGRKGSNKSKERENTESFIRKVKQRSKEYGKSRNEKACPKGSSRNRKQ